MEEKEPGGSGPTRVSYGGGGCEGSCRLAGVLGGSWGGRFVQVIMVHRMLLHPPSAYPSLNPVPALLFPVPARGGPCRSAHPGHEGASGPTGHQHGASQCQGRGKTTKEEGVGGSRMPWFGEGPQGWEFLQFTSHHITEQLPIGLLFFLPLARRTRATSWVPTRPQCPSCSTTSSSWLTCVRRTSRGWMPS